MYSKTPPLFLFMHIGAKEPILYFLLFFSLLGWGSRDIRQACLFILNLLELFTALRVGGSERYWHDMALNDMPAHFVIQRLYIYWTFFLSK